MMCYKHGLIFFYFVYLTDYKRYPVYASPLADRMRKRKAFADTHLEENRHIITMSALATSAMPPITNTVPLAGYTEANASATELLRNFVDYQLREQQQQYQQNIYPAEFIDNSYDRLSPSKHINQVYGPIKMQRLDITENKPKLAFSIESIIGIK